ncbi:MAG: magnesium transporter [Gammaproteobacteria bacterium]|nr:magnesium transporter [Gammaproteobacteria bacterium]
MTQKRTDPKEMESLLETLQEGNAGRIEASVADLHPADVAQLLEGLTPEERPIVWTELSPTTLGEVLVEVSEGVREQLLQDIQKDTLVSAIRYLDIDDIADLIPDLPDEVLADVLFGVDKEARASLGEVLSYPEDTAGGLMNVDPVVVRENISVQVVLRYLRLRGELPEYTDKLFVVGRNQRLNGVLPISKLLTAPATDRVRLHVDTDPFLFNVLDTQEDVAKSFEKYNLISAPVVDDEHKLLGRITIDDVVDVIREDADHSVMARAGLKQEEDIFAPVSRSARSRALWLGVNLITAVIASWVISQFEATIERLVALAVLMPIVASMGGNAGTQTLTVVIRGLSMGTITRANMGRVLKKEFLVGGLNGIFWAFAVALVAVIWYQDVYLGGIIALAMIINLVAAAISGVVLPILLSRLGIDPALAGGVALTTVTDVVGFFSLLALAALFLV